MLYAVLFTEQKAVTSHRGPLHPNHLEKKGQFESEENTKDKKDKPLRVMF